MMDRWLDRILALTTLATIVATCDDATREERVSLRKLAAEVQAEAIKRINEANR